MTRVYRDPSDAVQQEVITTLRARGALTIPEITTALPAFTGGLLRSPFYVRRAVRFLARQGVLRVYGKRFHASGPGRPLNVWGLAIMDAHERY